MNKYQFKESWGLGTAFYYCYGDNRFENYLNLKNIKYKKLEETDDSGFNEFNEKDKEIERLNNIINELDNFLDKQIEKENQLLNPKKGVKPYGDEKFYYEIYKSCLFDIKLKLNRLKENK